MLERKIDRLIEVHFEKSKSALLLTGARQTGKTFAIRNYAQKKKLNLIEVNFLESPSACDIFADAVDVAEVLVRLSAYAKRKMEPGRTLIFFDEVQKCPDVVTWIKFLVDDGRYRYALSGSLLGVELKNVRSVPVGYLSIEEVYPLDFEEFARALGVSDEVLDKVRECWTKKQSVDAVVHEALMRLIRLYLVVGGMPAVVQTYVDSNDIRAVQRKQKEILDLYKWDISQYDPSNKLFINEIFDIIPTELNAKNKRFVLKNLNEHAHFSRLENGFVWLKDAGVALPTYNVEVPCVPLKLNEQRNLFKLFQSDVGLLASQYADDCALQLLKGEVTINYGAIYENFVAQELHAHGWNLHYFNSKKQGELDFVIEEDGEVVPIEVKSGKDYDRHRALANVMTNELYQICKAYVLCNDNLAVKDKIVYLPIYMLMFIQRRKSTAPLIFKPPLEGLEPKGGK